MMSQTLGMAAGLGLRQGAVIRRQEEATKRGILAAEREKERLRKKQQKYTVQEKGTNMSGMFLLADFGETKRQNKQKRRIAEVRQAYTYAGVDIPDDMDLSTRLRDNPDRILLQDVRKKRNLNYADPLQYRSDLKDNKIIQPYSSTAPRRTTIGRWIDPSRKKYTKGNSFFDNTMYSPRLSEELPKLKAESIINNRILNQNIKNAQESSKNVTSLNSINKPKLNTGGLLLAGGLGLGAIGTGLYLANRKKKEKQNV